MELIVLKFYILEMEDESSCLIKFINHYLYDTAKL